VRYYWCGGCDVFDKAKAIRYEQPKNCILFRRQNLFHIRLKKASAKKKKED